MKVILCAIGLLFGLQVAADAQSMSLLMGEADLVVAGEVEEEMGSDRFQLYTLSGIDAIRGELPADGFYIVGFKQFSIHRDDLRPGARMLLFLRRLAGEITDLPTSRPCYTVLAGEVSCVRLVSAEERLWLDAARDLSQALEADSAERAGLTAAVLVSALTENIRELTASAAADVIATPGALEALNAGDRDLALERFRQATPASPERRNLLLMLGELAPAGLALEVEAMVASEEGRFCLDMAGAILAHLDDPFTAQRLVDGFDGLDEVARLNVMQVLGRLGQGKGVSALQSLIEPYGEALGAPLVAAFSADRTDGAVVGLHQMATRLGGHSALLALDGLARINTPAAREAIQNVADSESLHREISARAAVLAQALAR